MIQRGFLAVSLSGFTTDNLTAAMSAFFIVQALAVLAIGLLADRIKSSYLILLGGIAGTFGIIEIAYPWMFGLGFGIAAAVTKMIPFSSVLKARDGNDAMHIAPQAIAKTVGKAAFTAGLAATLGHIAFHSYVGAVAPFWMVISLWAYAYVRQYEIELVKWDWASIKGVLANYKWYVYTLIYVIVTLAYYWVIPHVIPSLMNTGMSKKEAAYLFATGMMILAPLRFGFAWLADKTRYYGTMFIAMAVTYVGLVWFIPVAPVLGTWLFMAASKASTPTYWPMLKQWTDKKYIGTAMGMCLIIAYLATGYLIGKWE